MWTHKTSCLNLQHPAALPKEPLRKRVGSSPFGLDRLEALCQRSSAPWSSFKPLCVEAYSPRKTQNCTRKGRSWPFWDHAASCRRCRMQACCMFLPVMSFLALSPGAKTPRGGGARSYSYYRVTIVAAIYLPWPLALALPCSDERVRRSQCDPVVLFLICLVTAMTADRASWPEFRNRRRFAEVHR